MIPFRILNKYQKAHDAHLDAAAKARRYDSIHTAALRAGYPGPFHDEGVAFASWMDQCNAIGYQIMAEIESGQRVAPTIDEYIAMLPDLVLP